MGSQYESRVLDSRLRSRLEHANASAQLWIVVASVACGVGLVAPSHPFLAAMASAAPIAVAVVLVWPESLYVLSLAVFSLAHTPTAMWFPIDPRLLAAGIALIAMPTMGSGRIALRRIPPGLRRFHRGILWISAPALVSLLWTSDVVSTMESVIGAAAGLAVLTSYLVQRSGAELGRDRFASAIAVACTLVIGLAVIAIAIGGTSIVGRAAFPFSNPNTLGVAAGIVAVYFAGYSRLSRHVRLPLVLIAIFVVLLSGSRGSVVALVAAGAAAMLARRGARIQTILAVGVAMVVAILVVGESPPAPRQPGPGAGPTNAWELLMRDTDSRSQYWAAGWHAFVRSPLVGFGAGATPIIVLNSYLLLLIELGLLGTLFVVRGLGLVVQEVKVVAKPWPISIGAFGTVAGVFEGWLFVGSSVLFVLFWLVLMEATLQELESSYDRPVYAKPMRGGGP